MAYRKSKGKLARRFKKIEPAVTTLSFAIGTGTSGNESSYIDLSQCASLVNRRFYRQGINWAVAGIKILTQSFAGQVFVYNYLRLGLCPMLGKSRLGRGRK